MDKDFNIVLNTKASEVVIAPEREEASSKQTKESEASLKFSYDTKKLRKPQTEEENVELISTLQRMKIKELMDELSKRNMRKRGQRSELINTLYELIKNEPDQPEQEKVPPVTPAPVDPLPAVEPPKSPVKPTPLPVAAPAIPVIVKSPAQPVPLPAVEPAIPVISDPKVSTSTASENGNKHNPPPAPVAPIPSTPKDGNQHNPPPVPVAPTTTASEDARKPVNINDAPPAPVVPETKGNSTAVWVQEEYLTQFLLRQFGDGVNSFGIDPDSIFGTVTTCNLEGMACVVYQFIL